MDVVRLLNDEEDRREIVRTSLESRKVLEGLEMFGLVSVMYTYFFRERRGIDEREKELITWILIF